MTKTEIIFLVWIAGSVVNTIILLVSWASYQKEYRKANSKYFCPVMSLGFIASWFLTLAWIYGAVNKLITKK
jgi:hypothetical protein